MKFISHADFVFPLYWQEFASKIIFLLNESGVSNLDNNLRFFIRLPLLILLFLTNNIFMSYFYIFSILIFSFFSFYLFSGKIESFRDKKVRILSSLLFMINPVFLGNLSKAGLVLSVAFLPLILYFINKYISERKLKNLPIAMIFLAISLIHPFNFVVNLFISIFYFILIGGLKNIKLKHFLFALFIFILIFSYIFIALIGSGSNLSKSEIDTSLGSARTSSNFLGFANTGGLFNAYIGYKPVLRDYSFFAQEGIFFFITGSLLFILAVFSFLNQKLKKNFWALSSWLFLIILFAISSLKFEFIKSLLEYAVNRFSWGWIFRSPLKWQLYIPFFISIVSLFSFDIIFNKINKKRIVFILMILLILSPNFYLSGQIYKDLLTPKSTSFVSPEFINNFQEDGLLIVKNKHFSQFSPIDLKFNTELSLILNSHPISYGQLEFKEDWNIDYVRFEQLYGWVLSYSEINFIKDTNLSRRFEFENGYTLYRNDNLPTLTLDGGKFNKANPIKINVYLENIFKKEDLTFNRQFHPNWKLYLKKNPSTDWCNPIRFYNNTNTTECEHTMKFLEGEEFSYLWKKPVFEESHTMIYDYANQWTIDPQYIKEHYSSDYYTLNEDGSIDIELVMYFKPQSYFYLGLLISGTTLIACFGYLIYDWKKNRNKKQEDLIKI